MTEQILAALCALHAQGQDAWPEIELDVAVFASLVGGRLGDGPFDGIRAADLYIATACAACLRPALAAFDEHYLSRIVPALVRRGHSPAAAADAVQIVRVRLLLGEAGNAARIAAYNGRGSLATWVEVAAVRTAISAHRKQQRETNDEVELVAADRGPELDLLHRRFSAEFDAAFRSTFEALSARERTLLRYQVIDRLGIDRIAAIYGVHRATAARWVAHARDALVDGVRRALQDQLGIAAEELDSHVRLVQSRLELSLQLLATPT